MILIESKVIPRKLPAIKLCLEALSIFQLVRPGAHAYSMVGLAKQADQAGLIYGTRTDL